MRLGQLWYTRAHQGAGGVNRFQILAASGRLDDRNQPLTQEVLKSCYRPTAPTLTWETQRGARIATHRLPAEADASGRPGNYFVHALVGAADALPNVRLAGLWGASGWQTTTPDPIPAKLTTLDSIDDLGLAETAEIEDDVKHRVVASFLDHLRQFRPSALDMEPGYASACAALLADVLPERLNAISFCSSHDDDQVDRYNIVAGRPDTPRFLTIEHDRDPDEESGSMARVLLDAWAGDPRAMDVVAAIDDRSQELVHFADGLHHWMKVDQRPGVPGSAAPREAIEFIRGDERLARALAEGPGKVSLAEAVAIGLAGTGELIAMVEPTEAIGPLVDLATQQVAATSPEQGAQSIIALANHAPKSAASVARGAVRSWDKGGLLPQLGGRARSELLGIIGARSPLSKHGPDALTSEASANRIASDPRLPPRWRAAAIWRFPAAISSQTLVTILAESPEIVSELVGHTSNALVDVLDGAIPRLTPTKSIEVALQLVNQVTDDAIRGWIAEALNQMDPATRVAQIVTLPRSYPELPRAWGQLLAASLDRLILDQRTTDVRIIPVRSLASTIQLVRNPTRETRAWGAFCGAADGLDASGYHMSSTGKKAGRTTADLDPALQIAALEFLFGIVHERSVDNEAWMDGVNGIWNGLGDSARKSAWSPLIRAAMRTPKIAEVNSIRFLTAYWIASMWPQKQLGNVFKDPLSDDFIGQLTVTDQQEIKRVIDASTDEDVAKALGRFIKSGSRRRLW